MYLNIKHYSDHRYQLLIVTGGKDSGSNYLDSTEVYQDNVWRTVAGKLPVTMYGMQVTAVSQRILLFGKGKKCSSL